MRMEPKNFAYCTDFPAFVKNESGKNVLIQVQRSDMGAISREAITIPPAESRPGPGGDGSDPFSSKETRDPPQVTLVYQLPHKP